jgi:hypothetical protein
MVNPHTSLREAFVWILACLCLTTGTLVGMAVSPRPIPSGGESKSSQPDQHAQETHSPAANDPRGSDASPLIVRIQPSTKTDQEAAKEQAKEQREAGTYWWNRSLAITTALVGLLTVLMIGGQIYITHVQNEVMRGQTTIMGNQERTTALMLHTTRIVESAYVNLSHTPPGIHFAETIVDGVTVRSLQVTLRVSNSGHTPADILWRGVQLLSGEGYWLVPNPMRPDPGSAAGLIASLMPNDHIDFWHNFPIETSERMQGIGDGRIPTFITATLIYRDRFGRRHRHGYARQYIRPLENGGNNLVFAGSGYNYDEELDQGQSSQPQSQPHSLERWLSC